MSYNPNRPNMKNNKAKNARKQASQRGGSTHSKVVRSKGMGSFAPMDSERQKTPNGMRSVVFTCEQFTNYYEFIYAGNNLGFGFTPTGNKTIRVARGTLFLITAPATRVDGAWEIDNTQKQISKIIEGSYINLPAGVAYCVASSGSLDVELLITESADYASTWIECESGVVTAGDIAFQAPAGVVDGRAKRVNSAHEREVASTTASNRRRRQASSSAAKNNPAPTFNPNSSSVLGVNPMPAMILPED